MEGISGVTRWEDVVTEGQDYQRARSWMTADVNAAVAGARSAGATVFVVEENHGIEMLTNLLLDEIDPEVEVVRGAPRLRQTTTAVALDPAFDAVFLVGHHAKAGDDPGICAHTISYGGYRRVLLNGEPVGEPEIFARMAAEKGVPTALVTGDDVVCAEMAARCPGVERAVVKTALGRTAGRIIPPVRAQRLIADAAARAVHRVASGALEPIPTAGPYAFTIELRQPVGGDVRASIETHHPEFRVVGDRTVEFEHDEMAVAYRMAAAVQFLVGSGRLGWY